MHAQAVIAITPEDQLPDILTHIHRAGLGHNARVLRPHRGPLRDQLRRAGVPIEQAPRRLDDAGCILLVNAAARSSMAADLALQHGASATWTVSTSGVWHLVDDRIVTGVDRAAAPILSPLMEETGADTPGTI
ncbi:MAG TPA: hypothetical protein VNZ55_14005 [Thermomicrobiales bacterium]|nr:hypothetical protein [Thermomicrobiales bacterium]